MIATYLLDVIQDDNGSYRVTCRSFPDINTFVHDLGQLTLILTGAIEEAIAARLARGEPIPASATLQDARECFVSEDKKTGLFWIKVRIDDGDAA